MLDLKKLVLEDNNGKILKLLDENNLDLLENNNNFSDIINIIISYSNYTDDLFSNNRFIDIFLKCNLIKIYKSINKLSNNSYENIINRCIECSLSPKKVANFFKLFNKEFQLKAISERKFSNDVIYKILETGVSNDVVKKIFENYKIDLANDLVNVKNLFMNAKKCNINSLKNNDNNYLYLEEDLISEEFLNRIWENYNLIELRLMLNDMEYSINIDKINKFIKVKEEEIIYSYDEDYLINEFKYLISLFDEYHKNSENNNIIEREIYSYLDKLEDKNIYLDRSIVGFNSSMDDLVSYLKKITQHIVTDALIDYHFEENYHNVIIDIKELLEFYKRGNINISSRNLKLYNLIINIDSLSNYEKRFLHEQLLNIDVKSMLYDDIRNAKDIIAHDLKVNSLNSNSLLNFYDENLSKKYGVSVYNLTGKNFFGIVKTGRRLDNDYPGGHSFSLIGNGHITVYGDIKSSDTYFYDSNSLSERQLVHVFPVDSYTFYDPMEKTGTATNRTYKLRTSNELLDETSKYNEILYLEKGLIDTDMDKDIPILKKLGLYCIDDINKIDVENANKNNVGIIFIDTKEHFKVFKKPIEERCFDLRSDESYLQNELDISFMETKRNR